MLQYPLLLMNRLNQTESAIFAVCLFSVIPRDHPFPGIEIYMQNCKHGPISLLYLQKQENQSVGQGQCQQSSKIIYDVVLGPRVIKVFSTKGHNLELTFDLRVIFWSGPTSLLSFWVLCPSIAVL